MISEVLQRALGSVTSAVYSLDFPYFNLLVKAGSGPFGIDTSIEGMKSQEFKTNLKKGEKILFAWILFGVIVAVIFGAAQMLHGYLF